MKGQMHVGISCMLGRWWGSGSDVHKQYALCLGGVLAARILAKRALW